MLNGLATPIGLGLFFKIVIKWYVDCREIPAVFARPAWPKATAFNADKSYSSNKNGGRIAATRQVFRQRDQRGGAIALRESHAAIRPGFSGKLSKSASETGTPSAIKAWTIAIRHVAGTPRLACLHLERAEGVTPSFAATSSTSRHVR